MRRLRQDVHILVRNLSRDSRSGFVRLVLGTHALARSATKLLGGGLSVAGHVRRGTGLRYDSFEGASGELLACAVGRDCLFMVEE